MSMEMDLLGVRNQVMKSSKQPSRRDRKERIKVKYICSPLKVKTSASNFRALVQELTGQDSNVAEAAHVDGENVHEKLSETQPWRVDVNEAYMPEADDSWFKPNYSEFHSSSFLLEPLNQYLQCNF
ncbi:hypothetical protein L6164_023163 [Bauhinia variegata]|uniref:Uncharacterized protein n=1 Tax=Bauhinia variegata TaxID=167791 RepID=A0ACB9MIS1_BAUVA|nr:hypothetical protein L6164_023163 [Bauhinia variegata]